MMPAILLPSMALTCAWLLSWQGGFFFFFFFW